MIPVSFIVVVMGLVFSILVKRLQEMNCKVEVVGVRLHQEERPGAYMEILEIDASYSKPATEYEVVCDPPPSNIDQPAESGSVPTVQSVKSGGEDVDDSAYQKLNLQTNSKDIHMYEHVSILTIPQTDQY